MFQTRGRDKTHSTQNATPKTIWSSRKPRDWDEDRIRDEGAAGTARERMALVAAGYCKPPAPTPPVKEPEPDPVWVPERVPRFIFVKATSMAGVVAEVANKYGISRGELLGHSRRGHLIRPRFEAYYRCYRELGKSLPQIGAYFERDHTTILHGIRRMEGKPSKNCPPLQ